MILRTEISRSKTRVIKLQWPTHVKWPQNGNTLGIVRNWLGFLVQILVSCSIQGKNYLEQAITILRFSRNARTNKIVFFAVSFCTSLANRSQNVPETRYNKRMAIVHDLIWFLAVYNLCRLSYSNIYIDHTRSTQLWHEYKHQTQYHFDSKRSRVSNPYLSLVSSTRP
jgi:hypothetical protein